MQVAAQEQETPALSQLYGVSSFLIGMGRRNCANHCRARSNQSNQKLDPGSAALVTRDRLEHFGPTLSS